MNPMNNHQLCTPIEYHCETSESPQYISREAQITSQIPIFVLVSS